MVKQEPKIWDFGNAGTYLFSKMYLVNTAGKSILIGQSKRM
jgi:hypothetical protein